MGRKLEGAASFALRLPKSTRNSAAEIAKTEGLSLNQFIVLALTEKIVRMENTHGDLDGNPRLKLVVGPSRNCAKEPPQRRRDNFRNASNRSLQGQISTPETPATSRGSFLSQAPDSVSEMRPLLK
jgi:hypothetical protein